MAISELQNFYKEELEQSQNAQLGNKTTLVDSTGKVQSPEFAKGKKPASYK